MTLLNDDVAHTLAEHLRAGTTEMSPTDLRVPISHFVGEERAAQERALLKRLPVIIGHGSEIARPGSFLTREILGMPLIVVRRSDGTVGSYLNICRHRGGRVEDEPCGQKRIFTCHYHGWSYSREDGGLRGVPYDDFYTHVDKDRHGLHRIRTEERHGFLFAVLSGDQDLEIDDWLGPEVDAQLSPYGLGGAEIFLDEPFTLDINWKIVLDGAIDVLHPKFLHPEGVGKLIETNTSVWRQYGRHGQSFSPRTRMGDLARAGEEVDADFRLMGSNLFLYPNSMVISTPDHVEFWTVWPDTTDPNRSTTQIRFLVRPEKRTERIERRIRRSWEILQDAAVNEDWPMELTIQQNAAAWPHGTFLYGRNEQACQHLHRELAADLGD
ncbi:ring hydroxylating dioxygenase, large subunit of terminal oxygenase [Pseudonocardia sp. Ae168_Ps1]|uniref:aromatic ring-hydroxylating oxygenase subunit alpha n=1 Tax=unclassified Pseudonocardia TaxID=2619320 RepID=UPI00094B1984|nr:MULTISPECIES: aromatic ring-hydroxylating dioxygenase subunit alpha [unclassified Pseudonocardia]OLL76021.1 ring hydroxylating dioxygenase, large subunit of terminal oxygenase [Pseudonocardia sp. Ae150A_Ps1]OLL82019.1 ring hydroxylating dioxygenase, large subunit of terminal oxygenase [Pseudonocardia sp. Ae168_Ps1]OLL83867.1 ring hydroxylating dioxygenase, large subunit of terminal oxygenase [Pseudonocardia sp. Ae263_Ps1]OLL96114.1 ring hydroxylating dioxygenase, large subunit of terminal ox